MTHHRTMKEIAEALHHRVDYVFAATSTCGTLMGCAEYIMRHKLPTKIVAVDAAGSVTFGKPAGQRLIPGHGAGLPSHFLDESCIFDSISISDHDCVKGCHELLAEEAMLCGGSSGAVVSALKQYRHHIPAGSVCALILCDRGERYLDTIYNPQWVEKHFNVANS